MDSASTIADGYHSIGDGTSNIIGIIGIELAKKPGDREHPYGHDKFVAVASNTDTAAYSKDGVTWTQVAIPTWPTKRWGFVACEIDLTAYASNKMQFMFENFDKNSFSFFKSFASSV